MASAKAAKSRFGQSLIPGSHLSDPFCEEYELEDNIHPKNELPTYASREMDNKLMTASEIEYDEQGWIRPEGKNAAIWNHFRENILDRLQKRETIRVKCIHCPSIFTHTSSTTNYWRHMRTKHESIKLYKCEKRSL